LVLTEASTRYMVSPKENHSSQSFNQGHVIAKQF
jgi:hypothetical protein